MKKITRRNLLSSAGKVTAAVFATNSISTSVFADNQKPNIVFILIDDLRWDHLSSMGHPFLKTPAMDRIAKEGVHFVNAFCTTSLCSPSRASFLTGNYAHKHGVKDNLTPWDNNKNHTFFENLKEVGYKNAFIGKWHMPGEIPQLRGVDRFITFPTNFKGGQGTYFDSPLIIDGVKTQRPGKYITEDLTDFGLQFIRENSTKPFCLYLSHKAVHSPWKPPTNLDKLYDDADISFLPKEYFSFISMMGGKAIEGSAPLTTEQNYRNYCETLVALDQQIARVLDEIDRQGIAENTVLVLASDNGYSWGEKIDIGKRDATEENIRIPFIIRYPHGVRNSGRRSEAMVLNIDLAPTLTDLAGAKPMRDCDGISLRPLIENSKEKLRDSFLYEYYKDFPYNVSEQKAIRTDKYLYVTYKKRRKPVLYNIQKDPRTLRNIIDTEEGKEVLPELQRLMRSYPE